MKFNRSAKGRRVVKGPAGRRRARNPVKSLQARTDLRDSYSQVMTSAAEDDLSSTPSRRPQSSMTSGNNSKQSHLAAEAILGIVTSGHKS